jgi:hypoxanthine phosphoribosyltransferase
MTERPAPEVLISQEEIAERVEALAKAIAPRIDDDTVAVCLLTGGLWFAADLTRALWRAGRDVRFDALWLASYHDERKSSGRCEVRADLQRPLIGRRALVVDDVLDTGLSLGEAAAGQGRRRQRSADRRLRPQALGQAAHRARLHRLGSPARYLVGYGLDDEGKSRGLPYIGAMD